MRLVSKFQDYFTPEFVKFFGCSTIAAGVNFGSRILFSLFAPYAIAIVLAYCCGIITAFVLNKIFVFKESKAKTYRQFMMFVVVNLFGLAQTLLVSLLLMGVVFPKVGFTFHPEEVAHLIGVGIPVFTSFLGHKYLSFK